MITPDFQETTSIATGNPAPQKLSVNRSTPFGLRAMKIVIVDDIAINIKVARAHLEQAGYSNFVCIVDANEALPTIHRENPDLVILDIMMPDVSGLDILQALRAEESTSQLPVLVLTGAESQELKSSALELGATDFLMKPLDAKHLLPRVRNSLIMKQYQDDLRLQVQQRSVELKQAHRDLIHCLARAAEYRDGETGAHVIRVGKYSGIIADELGLGPETVSLIAQAATLHDVGKIGIPDSILQKHRNLDDDDFGPAPAADQISLADHTAVGAKILEVCRSPVINLARSIALTHHEKWDGSGYPLGLAGEDIPIESRITAVADVFDTLNSKRISALPFNECLEILKKERGKHFDPNAVDAFFRRKTDIIAVQMEHAEIGQ